MTLKVFILVAGNIFLEGLNGITTPKHLHLHLCVVKTRIFCLKFNNLYPPPPTTPSTLDVPAEMQETLLTYLIKKDIYYF